MNFLSLLSGGFNSMKTLSAACTTTCIASASKLQCPAIELTAANLKYLRLAGLALTLDDYDESMFAQGFKKRLKTPDESKVETPSKDHVKADYGRKTLFTKWTDMTGRKRKHYKKPRDWTHTEITKTGNLLIDWKQDNDSPKKRCISPEMALKACAGCIADGQRIAYGERGAAQYI